MTRDRLDELALELFAKARQDAPSEATARRISAALEQQRNRPQGIKAAVAVAIAISAMAAGTMFLSRGEHDGVTISMDPAKSHSAHLSLPPAPSVASTATPIASSHAPRTHARDAGGATRVAPPTLSDELASLKRARSSLSGGEPAATLAELDRYDRTLHGKALRSEATVLRIEALSRLGQRDRAAALARQFVEKNPNDPLVDRARSFATQSSHPADAGR